MYYKKETISIVVYILSQNDIFWVLLFNPLTTAELFLLLIKADKKKHLCRL